MERPYKNKPIERMGEGMYRDVKKKLLSVALCVCMIIGMVQIVPKAEAAEPVSNQTASISGSLVGGSGASITFTVTYSVPTGAYDGTVHMPVLMSVKDPDGNPISNCKLTVEGTPINAGTYGLYLKDESNNYSFQSTSFATFTIPQAEIKGANFVWDGEPVAIKDSTVGAIPSFSKAQLVLGDGISTIDLTSDQYTVEPMKTVGASQPCYIHVKDSVKKNFTNETSDFFNPTTTCHVAYDLSGNDQYYVAFGTRESGPSDKGSGTYTGTAFSPELGIYQSNSATFYQPIGTDYFNVSYTKLGTTTSASTVKEAGKYTVTVTPRSNAKIVEIGGVYFTGTFTGEYTVTGKNADDLYVYVKNPTVGGANINLNPKTCSKPSDSELILQWNNGNEVRPEVVAVQDALGNSVNCTYGFENATGVGQAYMYVYPDAASNYEGSLKLEYFISSGLDFGTIAFKGYADNDLNLYYTKEIQLPAKLEVKNKAGNILVKGDTNHYVVTYNYKDSNGNWQPNELSEEDAKKDMHMAQSGTKRITIVGRGKYTGQSVSKEYTISKVKFEEHKDWFTLNIAPGPFYYNGTEQKPAVSVDYKNVYGETLTLTSDDVNVEYSNNINAGTAYVTVTAKSNSNFAGKIEGTFTIRQLDLADAEIEDSPYTYNRSAIQPKIVIKGGSYGLDFKYELDPKKDYSIVNADGTAFTGTLPSDCGDYNIFIQAKNVNIPNGNVQPIQLGYKIEQADIATVGFTLDGVTDGKIEWWGKDTKPALISGLKEGVDYSCSYSNCANVTTNAAVTITAIDTGNYKGTTTLTYAIIERSIMNKNIEISSSVTGKVGGGFKVNLSVVDGGEGVKIPDLVKGRDYQVTNIEYLTENIPGYPATTDLDDLERAGEYEITLEGIGSYAGTRKVKVGCGKDISDAQISLGSANLEFTYNTKVLTPSAISLQLPDGSAASFANGDFTVSYSRRDGTAPEQATINAGTVYVTAIGDPDKGYFGTTKVPASYTINPLNIKSTATLYKVEVVDATSCGAINGDVAFTFMNESIHPQIVVNKDNKDINLADTLDPSLDYEVSYGLNGDECKKAGSHTVLVTGKGNYTGTIRTTYTIVPMSMTDTYIKPEWESNSNYADGAPKLTLRLNGDYELVEHVDYEKAIVWKQGTGSNWKNVCVYQITGINNFKDKAEFEYEMTQTTFKKATDNENPQPGEVYISKWDMSELMVEPDTAQIKPKKFTLSYLTEDLTETNLTIDKDFEVVDWGTNTQPGTKGNSITVEGKGGFNGTAVFPLTLYTDIGKATIVTGDAISGEGGSVLYDGAKISVSQLEKAINENTLSELITLKAIWPDEGATIATKNYNVKVPNGYTPHIGSLKLTIEGTQAEPKYYAGSQQITVTVTGALDGSLVTAVIGDNNTVVYNGTAVTPGGVKYSVYDDKKLLKGVDESVYLADVNRDVTYADYDYVISFVDNTTIGLAQANIRGINKYSGTLTQPFKITYPFSKLTAQVYKDGEWLTYEGGLSFDYNTEADLNKPSVRLYYVPEGAETDQTKWGPPIDESLYKVTYDGYDRAGDAKIIITGPDEIAYKDILTGNGKTMSYKLTTIPIVGTGSAVQLTMNRTPKYSGNSITATDLELQLTYNGYELVEGVDYRLQYYNNVNASTNESMGSVVINGMGNFSRSRTESFQILAMSIDSPTDISVNVPDVIYTGSPEKPLVTIRQESGNPRTLLEGSDYEVQEYSDGANIHQQTPFTAVGSYYVVVKGKGNYSGTREIPYRIVERSMADGVEISFENSERCPIIDGVPSCAYDGKPHEPAVRVVYNGITLKGPDQTTTPDYLINYTNNINAGIAIITITGNGSFNGSKTMEFRIQPRDIAGEDFRYFDGNNNEFVDEVNYPFSGNPVEPTIKVADRGMPGSPELVRDTDYEVTYTDFNDDNNEHRYAGEVTLTVTGKGNYGGTKEFTYYIGEDISQSYTLVDGKSSVSVEYNGLVQAPAEDDITVVWGASTDLKDASGEKRYDIAFYKDGFERSNLVTSDQIENAGTYYVAVVGVPSKGTYAKSTVKNSCTYTINPRSIAPSYVLVSGYDGSYYYTGQKIEPKGITVEDTDLPVVNDVADYQRRTVKLINGVDYDLTYANNTAAGKASIIVTGKGNYTGNRVAYFNILSSDMDGNNTWDGTSEGTGSISNGSTTIAASDIILGFDNTAYNCMMYNGYERIPTVTINGVSNSEFIITASNNIRPGVATLTITGTGNNYTGTIIKNYTIKANLATYGMISAIADQVYTGYQITPQVTLTCGGNLLNQGSDYTVTYMNNTNVGRATVMASATSDSYYIGSATGSFNISNTAGGMEITGYGYAYTYTGYPIAPDVVVTMNGRVLNRGTDYTVTYSNNTNVGTATMTVTGIGSFSGTKTITYQIEAKNIENCLTTAVTNYQYTGSTYTPNVTVTDSSNGKTLVAGTDYTITYSNNTNPGTASITVTALSKNYTGSKVIPFKIVSAAVSGLRTSTIKNNSIKLAWTSQDYADGYQICNSSNRVVATTSKNSYTVKGLTSCTTYKFKVRSYVENADGSVSYGDFSTAVSAKTLLNTPTLKAKSTSKGKVTLTWTKVSKATGYEIYYSTKKNGIYTRLKTVSKSSARKYVDKGLASGEKYYYTIRAYRTSNGVKTYSNYNTIKSVKVK